MQIYSQRDPHWASLRIGYSKSTIGKYGCAITCLGMLSGKEPWQVSNDLRSKGGLILDQVMWQKAAEVLHLDYNSTISTPVKRPTIACTDFFASKGVPTHFFIILEGNKIVDPLDGRIKDNPYNIISYRNVTAREDDMTEDQKTAMIMAQAGLYWEKHHDHNLSHDEWMAIETECRRVVRGELNYTELLARWSVGQ